MSDLNSIDESHQHSYKSLAQLVEASEYLLKGSDTEKYMDLGRMYLTTLVTQVVYFQIKSEIKTVKKFFQSKFVERISELTLGVTNPKQLFVGMGMLCLSKNTKAVEGIISELTNLINLQLADLDYESKQKSIVEMDIHKKLDILHLSTDVQSQNLNQSSFTKIEQDYAQNMMSKLTFNLNISEVQENEEQIRNQINKYIQNSKDFASMYNHFINFKPKTFEPLEDKNDQVGSLFKCSLKFNFVNFFNENQIKLFSASQEDTNTKKSRSKTSKAILLEFFNAFPYVFKDFKHCMKSKNLSF